MYNNRREMVALKSTEDVESDQQHQTRCCTIVRDLVASPLRSALQSWLNLVIRLSYMDAPSLQQLLINNFEMVKIAAIHSDFK